MRSEGRQREEGEEARGGRREVWRDTFRLLVSNHLEVLSPSSPANLSGYLNSLCNEAVRRNVTFLSFNAT